jgi:hypothetical protein
MSHAHSGTATRMARIGTDIRRHGRCSGQRRRRLDACVSSLFSLVVLAGLSGPAAGAVGDLVAVLGIVGDTCPDDHVGVEFDGVDLWYSCNRSVAFPAGNDLNRVDPLTGMLTYSTRVKGGLGALSYDVTSNKLYAGWAEGNCGGPPCTPGGDVYEIQLVPDGFGHNVVAPGGVALKCALGAHPVVPLINLDDGLAFDANGIGPADDDLYVSADLSTVIHRYDLSTCAHEVDSSWAGVACFNSGIVVGGTKLYQGANGCNTIYQADKSSPSVALTSFSTGGARDEDLTCDDRTFAASGQHVVWSIEAVTDEFRAFEVEFDSCGFGGEPPQVCEPKTQGFWHRLCKGPHPEKPENFDAIVAAVSGHLAATGLPSDVCENLALGTGNKTPCGRAMAQYSALLLNVESGKLSPSCAILACGGSVDGTVQDALDAIDSLLPPLESDACKEVQSIAADTNEGACLD